jgi:hypothetical protein
LFILFILFQPPPAVLSTLSGIYRLQFYPLHNITYPASFLNQVHAVSLHIPVISSK